MTDIVNEPIDLATERDRRECADIDADQAHWEKINVQLFDVMMASGRSQSSLISATLNALLSVLLDEDGLEVDEAKREVDACLKRMFFFRKRRTP